MLIRFTTSWKMGKGSIQNVNENPEPLPGPREIIYSVLVVVDKIVEKSIFNLLNSSCERDSTFSYIEKNGDDPKKKRFSLKAFSFLDSESSSVYIHADVKICEKDDVRLGEKIRNAYDLVVEGLLYCCKHNSI